MNTIQQVKQSKIKENYKTFVYFFSNLENENEFLNQRNSAACALKKYIELGFPPINPSSARNLWNTYRAAGWYILERNQYYRLLKLIKENELHIKGKINDDVIIDDPRFEEWCEKYVKH